MKQFLVCAALVAVETSVLSYFWPSPTAKEIALFFMGGGCMIASLVVAHVFFEPSKVDA